jgi:hypothetical protein
VRFRLLLCGLAALALAAPAVAAPVPPLPATEISRAVGLKDAAQRGMVQLAGKGGLSGDQVQVDLAWKPVPGPVTVTVRLDIRPQDPSPEDAGVYERLVRGAEAELNAMGRAPGSPPVRFRLEHRLDTEGAPPTEGFHTVTVLDGLPGKGQVTAGSINRPAGGSATWATVITVSPRAVAREALRLAGLPDRSQDVYVAGGRRFPRPANDMPVDGRDIPAWARANGLPPGGRRDTVPRPGASPCDPMADALAKCPRQRTRLRRADLAALAGQAGVRLETAPGELLLSKVPGEQNFGTAASLRLFAPPRGTARAEGQVVYCVNVERTIPGRGSGFDVFGPASEAGGEGFRQLQVLLEAVARLPQQPDGSVVGAQGAVWALTNPADTRELVPGTGDEREAVLAAAGLPVAKGPGAAYVANPNAAAAATGAVGPGGVEPALPPAPVPAAPRPSIDALVLGRAAVRPGRAVGVDARLETLGAIERVDVVLERRAGRRWRVVRRLTPPPRIVPGTTAWRLALPRLRAGEHRVRVSGPGLAARAAALSVTRAPARPR